MPMRSTLLYKTTLNYAEQNYAQKERKMGKEQMQKISDNHAISSYHIQENGIS